MPSSPKSHSVDDHFTRQDPTTREVYNQLLAALRQFGPVDEEPKKTSIHLTRSSALAGVQVRKAHLVVTIKADQAIRSPRIHKSEQVSSNRFHHEVKLASPKEIDKELRSWLKAAYELSG